MKCLRSGYCCIKLDVVIVDDPDIGITPDNLKIKESGVKCQHLEGDSPGNYSCSIHHHPWYKETPCYTHNQVEGSCKSPCRVGEHILKKGAN